MKTDTISSARRAMRVLKVLKGHAITGLANKDIAEALGESPVNVTRALAELEAEGLVAKLDNGRFAHSVAMLQIAQAHVNHMANLQDRMTEMTRRIAAGAMG